MKDVQKSLGKSCNKKKIIRIVQRVWDVTGWDMQKEMSPQYLSHEPSDLTVRLILGITAKGSRLLDSLNCLTITVPTIDQKKPNT